MENSKRVFYSRILLLLNKFKFRFLRDEINSEVPYCIFYENGFIFLIELFLEQTELNWSNSEPSIDLNLLYLMDISRDK